jgi:hypothetical protein
VQSIRRQPEPSVNPAAAKASPTVVLMPMHDADEERRWDEQAARIMGRPLRAA